MTTTPVGQILREMRERRGVSLRAAANELEVDPSYLSRIERGLQPPSEPLMKRVAARYALTEEQSSQLTRALPDDIVDLLLDNPELIQEIRDRFADPH